MKVLLLGSGGRESALAWGLVRSASVSELIAAPGNPGIAGLSAVHAIDPVDPIAVMDIARRVRPDLVVIGPEAPLVAGVGDALRGEGIPVFGPDAGAARVEGSKAYAKELMGAAGIPTAAARSFTDRAQAIAYLDEVGPPYVIKADGLAAGKGVVVTSTRSEAVDAVDDRLVRRKFGDAGSSVLIEEFLDGQEASLIAFVDGKSAVVCEPAQDYKRIFDGDEGPNTGGMGSYSPVPACPTHVAQQIVGDVIEPMVAEMAGRGTPFVGALYAGLALTERGPRVIEFNARFGDPETQALIPRLDSDLGEACLAAARGELGGVSLDWSPKACVSVVLSAPGYPEAPRLGAEITGIDEAARKQGVAVFHAGTSIDDGRLVTSGGRVLNVSALGDTFADARRLAYEAAEAIGFEGMHLRTDIAKRAEEGEV